jgi:hypothetical protein
MPHWQRQLPVVPVPLTRSEVCAVRFEHWSPLELERQTPKSPISISPDPDLAGKWGGNPGPFGTRFGRNRETGGNRESPCPDSAANGNRVPGAAGISWSELERARASV